MAQPSSVRLTTGFLNTQDDPTPGWPLASPSGTIVQPYAGFIGTLLELSTADALARSSTGVGTLYAGVYQYVQFYLSSTQANARGQFVVWQDRANFIVTPDVTAANAGKRAGISLNTANTKGNWGWIQVAGKASVLMASITKATPADGDLVIGIASSSVGKGDILADATGITSPTLKEVLGVADGTPTTSAISLVDLWTPMWNPVTNDL